MRRVVLVAVVVVMLVGGCESTAKRDPGLAVLCSFVVPGGGQFYNGQVAKGLSFLIGGVSALNLFMIEAEGVGEGDGRARRWLVLYLGVRVWELIDAGVSAGKVNVSLGLTHVDEIRPALCYRLTF